MIFYSILTNNGNLLVANGALTKFHYFTPDMQPLQQAFSKDWNRAKNSWGREVETLELDEDPFPKKEASSFGSLAHLFP